MASVARDVHVDKTFVYKSDNKNLTVDQAVQRAIEQAKIDALRDEFGESVSHMNVMHVDNVQIGEHASGSTSFYSLSGSDVQGEWIRITRSEAINTRYEDGFWVITVQVAGIVRESKLPDVDIRYVLTSRSDETTMRNYFKSGDPMYLRFTSAAKGYLLVYLVDENNLAIRLLPCETTEPTIIAANRETLFFADGTSCRVELESPSMVQNTVFIIYSSSKLSLPIERCLGGYWYGLKYDDFLAWLSNVRRKDAGIIVKKEIITISE